MAIASTGLRLSRRKRQGRALLGGATRYLVGLMLALAFLAPILWMVSGALKSNAAVTASPPQIIPDGLHFENFVGATTYIDFWTYLGNSTIVTVVTVVATLLACIPAAYAFSVLRWRGREASFGIVLFSMMLPFPAVMIPLYLIFRDLGMIGSLDPLVIPPFVGQFVTPAFSSALAISANRANTSSDVLPSEFSSITTSSSSVG